MTQGAAVLRHPRDPDLAQSSKATAVLLLGMVAVATGGLIGGVIPATVALLLARSARAEIVEAKGYLTGTRVLRIGVRLAWAGILLAITAVVIASIVGILHLATTRGGPDHFAPGTN